jgi:hypothetical protein
MPRTRKGSPEPTTQGRPNASSATTVSITRRAAKGRQARPPIAPASVFGPVGRRRYWWFTFRCKVCGAHQFGRAPSLDAVTGERKAGCGHRVQIMAARVYTQPESGAAA